MRLRFVSVLEIEIYDVSRSVRMTVAVVNLPEARKRWQQVPDCLRLNPRFVHDGSEYNRVLRQRSNVLIGLSPAKAWTSRLSLSLLRASSATRFNRAGWSVEILEGLLTLAPAV